MLGELIGETAPASFVFRAQALRVVAARQFASKGAHADGLGMVSFRAHRRGVLRLLLRPGAVADAGED
jgi:hypothetical protein